MARLYRHHFSPRLNDPRTGFYLTDGPNQLIAGARALCEDGKVRTTDYCAPTGWSAWAVRATMRINGKRVAGNLTETTKAPHVLSFVAFAHPATPKED